MTPIRSLSWLSTLSSRERRLIGLAIMLVVGVGLIYGALLPGMSAARSAESRRVAALAQHDAARNLALAIKPAGAPADLAAVPGLAQDAGFTVVASDAGRIRVHAPGPAALLAWIASDQFDANIAGVTIEPAATGGVVAELRMESSR